MINTSRQLKYKIRNLALAKSANAQLLMRTYMTERLLERLSLSVYRDKLILKGGTLVTAMVGVAARSTMDIDVTVDGAKFTEDGILSILTNILSSPIDDGVTFNITSISAIMLEADYPGFRVSLEALFDGTITPLKIDFSTDDIITPNAVEFSYPLMFESRNIPVMSYNLETMLAEKIETILSRGILNTRMRDFYDVYILLKTHGEKISLELLKEALYITARKRESENTLPHAKSIIENCKSDNNLNKLWSAYAKSFPYAYSITWEQVIGAVVSLVDKMQL